MAHAWLLKHIRNHKISISEVLEHTSIIFDYESKTFPVRGL